MTSTLPSFLVRLARFSALVAAIFPLLVVTANAIPIRNPPVGIMCLPPGNQVKHPFTPEKLAASPDWTNPEVKGFSMRDRWRLIEPVEGKFDWTFFDAAVDLAHKYHKMLGLSVSAGVETPDWVYAAGAKKILYHQSKGGLTSTIPVPWDAVYQAKWNAFTQAMASRYASVPELSYVVMTGPGRDFEANFVNSADDVALFNQQGGQALWGKSVVTIAGFYVAAFPRTAIILNTGTPTPDVVGHKTLEQAIDTALANYPGHFGICSCSLNAHYNSPYSAKIIQNNATQSVNGYQMYLPFQGGTNKRMRGTLADALNHGADVQAHYIEVYMSDCSDPNQQQALHGANVRLAANATRFRPK